MKEKWSRRSFLRLLAAAPCSVLLVKVAAPSAADAAARPPRPLPLGAMGGGRGVCASGAHWLAPVAWMK